MTFVQTLGSLKLSSELHTMHAPVLSPFPNKGMSNKLNQPSYILFKFVPLLKSHKQLSQLYALGVWVGNWGFWESPSHPHPHPRFLLLVSKRILSHLLSPRQAPNLSFTLVTVTTYFQVSSLKCFPLIHSYHKLSDGSMANTRHTKWRGWGDSSGQTLAQCAWAEAWG